MLIEHLLETRIDGQTQIGPLHTGRSGLYQHDQVSGFIQCHGDNFLEGKQRLKVNFYSSILLNFIGLFATNIPNWLCETNKACSNCSLIGLLLMIPIYNA